MATLTSRLPSLVGGAPNYQAVSASDKFAANPNAKYILHYKNGATSQASGNNKVVDQVSANAAPSGASLAAGWADAVVTGGTFMGATSESTVYIDNSTRFRDSTGFINLSHGGTLTTMTVDIIGPL